MTNEEMVIKLVETEDRAKSNTRRIDRLEEQSDALMKIATSVEILAKGQERLEDSVAVVKEDVELLKAGPGRRWDKLVDYFILAIAGFLFGIVTSGLNL